MDIKQFSANMRDMSKSQTAIRRSSSERMGSRGFLICGFKFLKILPKPRLLPGRSSGIAIRNDSVTVRSSKCSSTHGRNGSGNGMGVKIENLCDEDKIRKDKDVRNFEEYFEEALRPKEVQAPNSPSRQERLEHELTHLPFRSRCEMLRERKV